MVTNKHYYSFGSEMPNKSYTPNNYRYGFNGKEKDDEIKGSSGTSYDFGARVYDSRLGRFFSMDPVYRLYPFQSPYLFASNNPIKLIDLYGEGSDDPVAPDKAVRKTVAVIIITTYIQTQEGTLKAGESITDYMGTVYTVGTKTTKGDAPFSNRTYEGTQSLIFFKDPKGKYWLKEGTIIGSPNIKSNPFETTGRKTNAGISAYNGEHPETFDNAYANRILQIFNNANNKEIDPDKDVITGITVTYELKKGSKITDKEIEKMQKTIDKDLKKIYGDKTVININVIKDSPQQRISITSDTEELKK
jgi:RHS repeat-associated protein